MGREKRGRYRETPAKRWMKKHWKWIILYVLFLFGGVDVVAVAVIFSHTCHSISIYFVDAFNKKQIVWRTVLYLFLLFRSLAHSENVEWFTLFSFAIKILRVQHSNDVSGDDNKHSESCGRIVKILGWDFSTSSERKKVTQRMKIQFVSVFNFVPL